MFKQENGQAPFTGRSFFSILTIFLVSTLFCLLHYESTHASTASLGMPGEVKVETDFSTGSRMEFSKSINITVNTNSPLGYKLLFSSDSEDSSLVSSDPKNDYHIPSVDGSDYELSKHMHNQYGYNIKDADDKIYHHIPSLSSPLKIKQVKDPLTAADTVKFNLGFELESSAQPGEYHRNLIFTLLAEDQASAQLVNGIEINKAIKKAVGITDANYLDNPLTTTPDDPWPDLNITVARDKCSPDITKERTSIISVPDSGAEVYLGSYRNSWDKICIWSNATELIFPEDLSYMYAGLGGIDSSVNFNFANDRSKSMLNFKKVKTLDHLFQNTIGYDHGSFEASSLFENLKDSPIESGESIFENSTVQTVDKFANIVNRAKNLAYAFRNTKSLKPVNFSDWVISEAEDTRSMFEGSGIGQAILNNATFAKAKNTANMFKDTQSSSSIQLPKAVFGETTNTNSMFMNSSSNIILLPQATFAKTTDFSNMFKGATNASTIDLSKITFSAATNLSGIFQDTSAEQLTLNNTNLAGNNITDMSFMFKNSKVKNIDLGSMQTGPLTSIVEMFKNTNNLETITLPSVFNTSNITDMSSLFENNIKLTTINNLANLDTTNVQNMSRMFASDFYLPMQNIIPNLRANKVEDTSYMFYGTRATSPVVFPATFDTENLTDMSYMFMGFTVPSLDISNFKLGNVTTMEGTFSAESKTTAVGPVTWPSGQINMPHLTTMRALFKYNTAQNQIILPILKTPTLTDTSYMFYGIGRIDKIDNINALDTANVTTMEGMFAYNDTSLMKGENVKFEFNTGKVKNMNLMFKNSYVNYLDLSSFDTRSLVTAVSTFDYTWLKILDLTNWDTRNLEDVTSMFSESTWLVTIYASESFVTTKVTASENIFYSVTYDLGSGAIGNSITYARIGAPGAPGAFTKKS